MSAIKCKTCGGVTDSDGATIHCSACYENLKNNKGTQKMKIYISGQITGLDLETAKANFQKAEDYLRSIGHSDIVNPMKIHPEGNSYTWAQYMRADLTALMDCDAIFLLPKYYLSRGANIEKRLAEDIELTIIYGTN